MKNPIRRKCYAPEHAPAPQEKLVCTEFKKCKGCPYPTHGFLCWHKDGQCMRTDLRKIYEGRKQS